MRFEQTRTILQKLAPDYHRQVSDHYQRLADGDVSPRVRLMLEYLIDHEDHRALAFAGQEGGDGDDRQQGEGEVIEQQAQMGHGEKSL